jgi:hypothetical protein
VNSYFTPQLAGYCVPNRLFQLLHFLSGFASPDGGNVYPSIDRMAWGTSQPVKTVKNQLLELKRIGVLITEQAGTRMQSAKYRINLKALPQREQFTIAPTHEKPSEESRRGPKSGLVTTDEAQNRDLSGLTRPKIGTCENRQDPKSGLVEIDKSQKVNRQVPDMDLDLDHDHEDLDLKISTTLLTREANVKRPDGFIPTADNLSKWEPEYRLARVPHSPTLYHYDLHHLADGADRRGAPKWKSEAIEGVKSLAKKGRLGSDRKETAMADHEAQGYLSKRLSHLRSYSAYESAIGDLETAYAEGCAVAKARQEIEERTRSRTEPVVSRTEEAAAPNPELRKKTHETFLAFMASRGLVMPQEAQQATQAPLSVQSHTQPSQSGLNGDFGAVAA